MAHKIAVTYQSNYGTTKRYAQWLSESLSADLFERSTFPVKKLDQYDLIIHGGGIYAGGILGANLLRRFPHQRYILFTVGLADPTTTDYSEIIAKNVPKDLLDQVKCFHFRGGIDYQKLSWRHLLMMKMMKKMNFDSKKYEDLTPENQQFLETFGKQVDFTDQKMLEPLIHYVKHWEFN